MGGPTPMLHDIVDLANLDWTVRAVAGWDHLPADLAQPSRWPTEPIPAQVPGCIHTDLLAAGLIADPYLGDREAELAWIGYTDWLYRAELKRPAAPGRARLVFDGLDTVASVAIDGTEVLRAENMHRRYEVDVDDLLGDGCHELTIRFDSAMHDALTRRTQQGELGLDDANPYNVIRKRACNFGWDWGPAFVTCGIWRPARLELVDARTMTDVRTLPKLTDDGVGVLEWDVELGGPAEPNTRISLTVCGIDEVTPVPVGAMTAHGTIRVPGAEPWWPHTHGRPTLHPARLDLLVDQSVADTRTWRTGFRSVRVRTDPDDAGRAFTLEVNGVPVWTRGVNWIPPDCFPHRSDDLAPDLLTRAAAGNVNLVRVWGGGDYASDTFMRTCDELGLLVWQDFAFACAAYPEDESTREEVAAEARENTRRLATHPSLTLWSGSNENLLGWHDWGWRRWLDGRPWGAGYYDDLLPSIVATHTPSVPYIRSSPSASDPHTHPNDPGDGPTHLWDVWNTWDYTHYRDSVPRLVAEFGFQSPASRATLVPAITAEHDRRPGAPFDPSSPLMAAHEKQVGGLGRLLQNLQGFLPAPSTPETWHWATSLNHADAMALALGHFRAHAPRCGGAIVWQLNDCWPTLSWSLIDSGGVAKPAWFAVVHGFADRIITFEPRDGRPVLYLSNDSAEPWHATVDLGLRSLTDPDGWRTRRQVEVNVAPRSVRSIDVPAPLMAAEERRSELLVAQTAGARALWRLAPPDAIAWPKPEFELTAVAALGATVGAYRYDVVVQAVSWLDGLCLEVDQLDPAASVDDGYRTLAPGETWTFHIDSPTPVAAADVRRIVRTRNELFHPLPLPREQGAPAPT